MFRQRITRPYTDRFWGKVDTEKFSVYVENTNALAGELVHSTQAALNQLFLVLLEGIRKMLTELSDEALTASGS